MKKSVYNKVILWSVIGLIFIVWAILVIKVNVETEATAYKSYKVGDEVEYKGYTLKVNDYEKFSEKELLDKYNITRSDLNYEGTGFKLFTYVLWMDFTKTEDVGETLVSLFSANNLVSKGASTINGRVVIDENGEKNGEIMFENMPVGETRKLGIMFPFVEDNLASNYVKNFDKYPLYLELLDYEGHRYITKIELN